MTPSVPGEAVGDARRIDSSARHSRRAGIAGLAGSFLEWYDFATYSFLIVYMGPLFFPSENSASSVLASFGVFAVGYIARPFGGLFFGHFGDRHGRRSALLVTVVGMGGSTTVMGLLPTYAQVGVAAPILLVLVRMVQGFSTGGETSGAATLVAESNTRRHGLRQAAVPSGASLGSAAAPAVVGATTAIVGHETMAAWGWRLPLVFSAVLTVALVIYRLKIDESREFTSLVREHNLAGGPLVDVLRLHWPRVVGVALLALATGVPQAILLSYMNVYLIRNSGLSASSVYWASAIAIALSIGGYFLGGHLVDRWGPGVALTTGLLGLAVCVYPAMAAMIGNGSVLVVTVLYTVILVFTATATTPVWAVATRAFPTALRFSGVATGTNVGSTLGQGFGPVLATALASGTGLAQAPAILIVCMAVVGIVVGLVVTHFTPMRAETPAQARSA